MNKNTPSDITIIAIVFALILLVVFFSAIILYLAFRIKETFSKETRRGATVAKVAFLIGILFLAGGIFYFAASTLANQGQPPGPSPTPTTSPSPSPSATTSPPDTTSASPTPTATTPSPTGTANPSTSPSIALALNIAYPPTAKMNSTITITFTITNPTPQTAHSAILETNTLLQNFQLLSSSKPVVGNVITVGDIPQGNTIVTIQLGTPRSGTYTDTVKLIYLEAPNSQITGNISIIIRGN